MQTFDEPQQQGGGGCSKALLWILAILGGGAILCCGGGGIAMFWLYRVTVVYDPARIREATETVTAVELPERYTPKVSIQPPFVDFKVIVYTGAGETDTFTLVSFPPGTQVSDREMRAQSDQALQQQGQGRAQINIQQSDERKVTIRGEERTAIVGKGMSVDGHKIVQVQATFTNKAGGPAMMMMTVPEEQWTEEEFEAIVKSMQ